MINCTVQYSAVHGCCIAPQKPYLVPQPLEVRQGLLQLVLLKYECTQVAVGEHHVLLCEDEVVEVVKVVRHEKSMPAVQSESNTTEGL